MSNQISPQRRAKGLYAKHATCRYPSTGISSGKNSTEKIQINQLCLARDQALNNKVQKQATNRFTVGSLKYINDLNQANRKQSQDRSSNNSRTSNNQCKVISYGFHGDDDRFRVMHGQQAALQTLPPPQMVAVGEKIRPQTTSSYYAGNLMNLPGAHKSIGTGTEEAFVNKMTAFIPGSGHRKEQRSGTAAGIREIEGQLYDANGGRLLFNKNGKIILPHDNLPRADLKSMAG